MAQLLRGRFGSFGQKYFRIILPRVDLPIKYQRSCFHTSWILDVKGQELLMPALSPTMESGTIVKWLKKEGDEIDPGNAVADIQTDKAVMAMEIEDELILAKIIVPEGTKDVKVGTLIALTVAKGEDWKSVGMPDGTATSTGTVSDSSTQALSEDSSSAQVIPDGQHNLMMPALSPTMTSGVIVKWLKKEGDSIEPGDAVADIQTDKAVMSFELEEEVILAKIIVPEGSQVEVGQLIALTMDKDADWTKATVPTNVGTPQTKSAPTQTSAAQPSKSTSQTHATTEQPVPSGQVYGLAVKRLLEEYGLSSGSIKGTGRPNRLLKSDVLDYIQRHGLGKVAAKIGTDGTDTLSYSSIPARTSARGPTRSNISSLYTDVPVSNIRGVIAKRLSESKRNIPHAYEYMDINIYKLSEMRKELKENGVNVSINDFVTKAVAHALLQCPAVNTLYQNNKLVPSNKVDISMAVSTPSGLITPIITDVPSKSLEDISKTIRELAGRAREGKLQPHEFQGGSFTISNLGMFGIKEFSAIINPPQTAILAVGTGREELDSALNTTTRMTVVLSYDSRAIEEDEAADFLIVLRALLEDPKMLAVGRGRGLRNQRGLLHW